MTLSRRTLLIGAAALPFLQKQGFAQKSQHLRIGLSAFPPNLTPWTESGAVWKTINFLVHRGLLSYSPDGQLRGEIAEKWNRVGDTGWRFTLRNASFSNGLPITSADVKWSIEQITAPNSTAYMRTQFRDIERIETPDERTVVLHMKEPTATLPQWMAMFGTGIVARDSIDKSGQGIGAGPFAIKASERGVSIDLVSNDKYYKAGLPKLKSIHIRVYADENLRVAALESGDVDWIDYVPWQSMNAISANSKLTLDSTDGPFMYLLFNGKSGPFADARVRRAAGHVIRREEIIQSAFFGRGAPLEGLPLPPSSEFFNKERSVGWRYDLDLAKKLLQEAGAAEGFTCTMLSTAQYGMHLNTALVVQQNLAKVGIKAELKQPDWATRVAMGNRGQFDVGVMGNNADNNDPDGLASIIDGELPPVYTRSFNLPTPEIHKLFLAGRAEFDPIKRRAIYAALEKRALEDAPIIGLTWRSQGYATARGLHGFRNMPGALSFYSSTTLEDASFA